MSEASDEEKLAAVIREDKLIDIIDRNKMVALTAAHCRHIAQLVLAAGYAPRDSVVEECAKMADAHSAVWRQEWQDNIDAGWVADPNRELSAWSNSAKMVASYIRQLPMPGGGE